MNSKMKTWITAAAACCLTIPVVTAAAQTVAIPGMDFRFVEADGARDAFNSGRDLYEAGKYVQAESVFRDMLRKWPKNTIADRGAYYLIRTLGDQGKIQEMQAEIEQFQKTYKKSVWLKDVIQYQMQRTNQATATTASYSGAWPGYQVTVPPPPTPPAAPAAPAAAPAPPARLAIDANAMERAFRLAGRNPAADANPELTLQREALLVLFDSKPDRAVEICDERLKSDPKDELVLSSLNLVANSKSDKALPLLVSIAKTSPAVKARRDAVYWISRTRGDKDAITEILVGFVSSMTGEEDANAVLYALSQINTPKAVELLAGMARDKNRPDTVRLNAISRLAEVRMPNRVSMLDDIYKSAGDNAKVRRQAVAGLARGKEPEVVSILSGVASNDTDISVRMVAVNYLGQSKTPEAQKALEDFLLKKKP